ncbi:helix-turn-helix domain-containing protein [Enterococcus faecalis]|uniref:helix-turn-helix domain-containing protein n=1 Tax=Enterococcus faecalis TaxID=1351 RepID=UPI00376F8187
MMNYEIFLNKEDQRSYSLLRHLEESPTLSGTFIALREELSMSNFLVKKTLEKLKADIDNLKLSDSLTLVVSDVDVTLEIDGNYSSKLLLTKYLTESLSFKLVLSYFRGNYSLTKFAECNHVSTSVAYSTLQRLKKALKEYQIYFSKREIVGNQKAISFFLYKLFTLSNQPISELYSVKVYNEAKRVLQSVELNYTFTTYERRNFFHYLAIMINNEGRAVEGIDTRALNTFSEELIKKSQVEWALASKSLTYTVVFFLYLHGKLEKKYVIHEDPTIESLTRVFIGSFEKAFNCLEESTRNTLEEGLAIIHFNVIYFPLNMFDDFEMDLQFFKQTYPEFYFYLIEYIRWLTAKHKKIAKANHCLFFNYLLLLINHVPVHLIAEPAKVLIDFSYGKEYNQFIKKNLSVYVNLNVEIIDPLSDTLPDVVITNLNNLYQEEQSKVMVWLDPPRSIDWVNLTQSLLTIQEEKYQQQKESTKTSGDPIE